jgi:hypothetical protein
MRAGAAPPTTFARKSDGLDLDPDERPVMPDCQKT